MATAILFIDYGMGYIKFNGHNNKFDKVSPDKLQIQ